MQITAEALVEVEVEAEAEAAVVHKMETDLTVEANQVVRSCWRILQAM